VALSWSMNIIPMKSQDLVHSTRPSYLVRSGASHCRDLMSAAALEQLGVTEEEYVRYITQNVDGRRVRVGRPTLRRKTLNFH
jgi:hypothetical protein